MMIDWRDPDGRVVGAVTVPSVLRWTLAGLAVAVLHGGGVWLVLNWPASAEAPGDPPAAIMMDLAPLAVAPEAPQEDIAPGPEMVEAEEQPEPEPEPVEEEPEPEREPEPEKPVEDVVEPEPEPEKPPVETEIKPPDLPKVEAAEAVLPPKVELPKPRPKPKPKKKQQKAAPRTTAPASSQAQRADRAAAPTEGVSSSMSPASWRGSLMAHLNRYKRFPPGGGQGTAVVAFSINRTGVVTSARLVRSSGDGALDSEAVGLVRRASPVPAPPSDVGGTSISLTVPVRFAR